MRYIDQTLHVDTGVTLRPFDPISRGLDGIRRRTAPEPQVAKLLEVRKTNDTIFMPDGGVIRKRPTVPLVTPSERTPRQQVSDMWKLMSGR